ncbi:class I SAM-dependent methyltransferase [Pendulispora albinea]|uniref:Class I SAM-dependent methyltransferase n=1 Tax=Pendulispora albinea TaxID=2741071 RepID=A0ABZ2LW71_9BACT
MDIVTHNREAWDNYARTGNRWTVPVSREEVEAARRGEWAIVLTPHKPVPRAWFPRVRGAKVLALAGGGGQQGPILAAAGYDVTVFDNSPAQLAQDRKVAERDGLALVTVQGDMADLGCFESESFDLIVHPCSNCFVPDVHPVWREAYRVLRYGGALLAGFADPILYAIDTELEKLEIAQLQHAIPYSDMVTFTEEQRRLCAEAGEPLQFGHTLEDQLGGQTDAGFLIAGYYGDKHLQGEVVSKYMPCFGVTRALKLDLVSPA